MRGPVAGVLAGWLAKPVHGVRSSFGWLRARRPIVDHAARAYHRYDQVQGDQLAAAVTFFGFLSFFPLLVLGYAFLGFLVDVGPDARAEVTAVIERALPGLVGDGPGQIDLDTIAAARRGAGILGLLGLLLAGTGWVDSVRSALRAVFGTGRPTTPFPVRKAVDVALLAALGLASLLSLTFTGLVTSLTGNLLAAVELDGSPVAAVVLRGLTLALVLAADLVLFGILLSRLPGCRAPWRRVWSGALVGAVGFEVLKLLGTFLVGKAVGNPVYAGVAVAVGLLVWTNLVSRLVVFAAAWTATQPHPPEPSADAEVSHPPVPPEEGTGPQVAARWSVAPAVGAAVVAGMALSVARSRRSGNRAGRSARPRVAGPH